MRRAIMSANRSAGYVAVVLTSLLLHPANSLSLSASTLGGLNKPARMTEDQRIAHVLSRLTFGARPGDFEKVKAMGVEAFINQQLDPDSIENGAVIAKLRRLPTLGMATPVIIEQYTPPKPVASPSPAAKPADITAASRTANSIATNLEAARMPALPTEKMAAPTSAPTAMQNETQMDAKKDVASTTPAGQTPSAKPTPPPKNPQMV